MKLIRKAERLAFNDAITRILSPFHPSPEAREYRPGIVRCMTDCGPLTITPDFLKHGDKVATVFSRFRDTDNPEFQARRAGLGASMVGKWNIHTFDPEQAVLELETRLRWVNARPLTDAELDEWDTKTASRELLLSLRNSLTESTE